LVHLCLSSLILSFSSDLHLPVFFLSSPRTPPNATWQPLSSRPFHFPTGSPSASSLRSSQGLLHSCNRGASRTLVGGGRRQRVSRSRGSAAVARPLRSPSTYPSFSVLTHTTRRDVAAAVFPPFPFPHRQSECIILAKLTRPFALVQSGCFSYSRWRWAQTAGLAVAGKCGCCWAAPESESELLSKKLGWVGVFATS
jgi:hypothetical protein